MLDPDVTGPVFESLAHRYVATLVKARKKTGTVPSKYTMWFSKGIAENNNNRERDLNMQTGYLLRKAKDNKLPFGLMEPELQTVFRQAGRENVEHFSSLGWLALPQDCTGAGPCFNDGVAYRLKKNYAPVRYIGSSFLKIGIGEGCWWVEEQALRGPAFNRDPRIMGTQFRSVNSPEARPDGRCLFVRGVWTHTDRHKKKLCPDVLAKLEDSMAVLERNRRLYDRDTVGDALVFALRQMEKAGLPVDVLQRFRLLAGDCLKESGNNVDGQHEKEPAA